MFTNSFSLDNSDKKNHVDEVHLQSTEKPLYFQLDDDDYDIDFVPPSPKKKLFLQLLPL